VFLREMAKRKPPAPPPDVDSHAHFRLHDTNGDAGLDKSEFRRALRGTHLDPRLLSAADAAAAKTYIREFFASLAAGKVDYMQWKSIFEEEEEESDETEGGGDEKEEEWEVLEGNRGGGRAGSRSEGDKKGGKGSKEGKTSKVGGGGGGGGKRGSGVGGEEDRYVEGDLVRIVGFDAEDDLSVHNGEVAHVLKVNEVKKRERQTVIVRTLVAKQTLQLTLNRITHARNFAGNSGGQEEEEEDRAPQTEEEAEMMYFQKFDLDKNGRLDRSELRVMFSKVDSVCL
jgi:Ca2+-binding EF-hand superfamily protein